MKSPLSYLGGKSRLAERIVTMIPTDHVCYCEAFCGAAWVFFRKDPSEVEVVNDLDSELVTFFRVVQNHLEEFLRYFKYSIVSREIFDLEQKKDPVTLTDIQRAVRYFYLQKNAFGGKVHKRTFGTGTTMPPRLNLATIEESMLEVHWRLRRVYIEHLDAVECVEKYDRKDTFFYMDPPYWKTHGYAVPFVAQDYDRLRKCLDKIKGRFLLSLNDTPEVRQIYHSFKMQKVTTSYSAANGRDASNGRSIERAELLIRNF